MSELFKLLLLCCCLLAQPALAQCQKTLSWLEDYAADMQDLAAISKDTEIEWLIQALGNLDCKLNVVQLPWARALIELQNGRIDIIAGADKTQEREKFAWYSSIPFYSPNVVYVRLNKPQNIALSQLDEITQRQLKIGTLFSSVYGEEFSRRLADPAFAGAIQRNTSRKALWQMLQLDRLDGVIAEQKTAQIELRELGLDGQIGPSHLIVSNEPAYIIYSKLTTPAEFVDKVDQQLRQFQALTQSANP